MSEPAICFVCGNIYPLLANQADLPVVGGSEVQQLLVGQGLRQLGFQISYVSEDFGQGSRAIVNSFTVLSFRLRRNKIAQAFALLRALRRAAADVYCVVDMPKYGALIYVFCRLTGRKIVQALASDVEVETVKGDPRGTGWAYLAHAAWRRRADLVLAQTTFQAERLRARWGIAAEIAPCIVPVPLEEPEPRPSADCFRVLWVGRLSPFKRAAWIPEIARRLPDMEFVVVGGRTREAPDHYETVAPLLRACQNVSWQGFVPYPQVDAWFRSARVLLHTSGPGSEGFPNVFLQAWAAGIPVVSTGSDPDGLLTQRGLGLLAGTVEEAAEALRQLAADPARCQEIGRRGRAYVWETHRPEAAVPRLAALFRQLVQTH